MALFRRLGDEEVVVIGDVRFPNEVAAVRARRGVVIAVDRAGADADAGADAGSR